MQQTEIWNQEKHFALKVLERSLRMRERELEGVGGQVPVERDLGWEMDQ